MKIFYFIMLFFLMGCAATVQKKTVPKTVESLWTGNNRVTVSPAFELAKQRRIAVFPFKNDGIPGTDEALTEKISLLCMELGFSVVDRSVIKDIMKEAELEMSGILSGSETQRLGKILNTDLLVYGTVSYSSGARSSVVSSMDSVIETENIVESESVKFVDALTGELLISAFIDTPSSGEDSLSETLFLMLKEKIGK